MIDPETSAAATGRGPGFWIPRLNDILAGRFDRYSKGEFPHPEQVFFTSTTINRFMEMAYQVGAIQTCLVLSELDLMIREAAADGGRWKQAREEIPEKVREFEVTWQAEMDQALENGAPRSESLPTPGPEALPAPQPLPVTTLPPIAEPVSGEEEEPEKRKYDGTFGYIRSLTGTVNEEMFTIYLVETAEQINAAEQALLAFEADPSQSDLIHNIFRILHTIKGNSGLMGFHELAKLTHAMEQRLEPIRNKRAPADSISMDLMLTGIDLLTRLYGNLQRRYRQLTEPDAAEVPEPVEWRSVAASFEAPAAAA